MVELKVFTMNGCSFCAGLKEHLKEEAVEYKEYLIGGSDREADSLSSKFGLTSFPTLFFIKDNKILDIQVGFDSRNQSMREVLDRYESTNR